MTKREIYTTTFLCATSLLAGTTLEKFTTSIKSKPQPAKDPTEAAAARIESHYDSIFNDMWCNHTAQMTGFQNALFHSYDSIQESRETDAKKNAAMANALKKYEKDCRSFHSEWLQKMSTLSDEYGDSIASVVYNVHRESR